MGRIDGLDCAIAAIKVESTLIGEPVPQDDQ
jgi:hypothetical protein